MPAASHRVSQSAVRPAFAPSRSARILAAAIAATAAFTLASAPDAQAAQTSQAAQAAQNTAAADHLILNEVESNGDSRGDWVEVANPTSAPIDVSGYTIVDNDPKHTPMALSTLTPVGAEASLTLAPGAHRAFYTESGDSGFGLGKDDSVTLANPAGVAVDTTSWPAHAEQTWGRLPDLTGDFAQTPAPTPNAANSTGEEPEETPNTRPWPLPIGSISNAFPQYGDLGEDWSGVDFGADATAYLVNNGTGELLVLSPDDSQQRYTVTARYALSYQDGAGLPDAEGVTVGEGGRIYVATERNDANKSVSRPSVLEFTLPAARAAASGESTEGAAAQALPDSAKLMASQEWNLREDTGDIGANAGPEAVEWLPAVMGGVFAVGVEGTGEVLFEKLAADGSHRLVSRWTSPTKGVMSLDYQPSTGTLLVASDQAGEGLSVSVTFDGDTVKPATNDKGVVLNDRPSDMPNYANEGFALFQGAQACEGGSQQVTRYLWADDDNTEGVAVRQSTVRGECVAAPGPAPSSSDPSGPDGQSPSPTPSSGSSSPSSSADPSSSPAPSDDSTAALPRDDRSNSDSDLPRTGAQIAAAVAVAVVLLCAGAVALLISRRRLVR